MNCFRKKINNQEINQVNNQEVKRLCLLIGINYTGSDMPLNGCINDNKNLMNFLIKNNYYLQEEIIWMHDDLDSDDELYPTRQNIENKLEELVQFSNNNKKTKLFVAYSGHGTNLEDLNQEEEDGRDEALCPVDCDDCGVILDDYLRENFINKLSKNTELFMMADACHSGTICDLKYNLDIINKKLYNNYKDEKDKKNKKDKSSKNVKCSVVLISGCLDRQTSADAELDDMYQGAMTRAFLNTFYKNISYFDLLNGMCNWLIENDFEQVSQMSFSHQVGLGDTIKF